MSGILEHGAEIEIDTTTNTITKGDLVVFRSGDKLLIKRVLGLPGTPISVEDQTLIINQDRIPLQNAAQAYCWKDWLKDYHEIPDKCIFVLGTIGPSIDSRRLGFILYEDIIGIAIPK